MCAKNSVPPRFRKQAKPGAGHPAHSSRSAAGNSRVLEQAKAISQGKTLSKLMEELLVAVFADKRPADRILGAMLRANRQLGSRDRRFISESVFSFFRYLGFTSLLLTGEEWDTFLNTGKLPEDPRKFAAMIVASWLFEQTMPLPDGLALFFQTLRMGKVEKVFGNGEDILHFVAKAAGIHELRAPYSDDCICPEWTVEEFHFSESQRQQFFDCLRRRPPMWIRTQADDLSVMFRELGEVGVVPQAHSQMPQAYALYRTAVNLFTLESFRNGTFEVQDLASQCIGAVANPKPGERWWDACAGAGGKSLQLASLMNRKGTVVASDIRAYKLDDLKLRARRSSFPNIMTKEWDGKRLKENHRAKFDGVLVDAPCSCAGTWRRNPDARWTMQKSEITEIAELQLSILEKAAEAVKKGGVLVYATCSMIATENTEVVEKFLAKHPEYSLENFVHPLTGNPVEGMLQVYPWDADCDGMFVAKMRLNVKETPVTTE